MNKNRFGCFWQNLQVPATKTLVYTQQTNTIQSKYEHKQACEWCHGTYNKTSGMFN